jgi:hypothetical protein
MPALPEPVSGRTIAMGSTSAGKPMRPSTGSRTREEVHGAARAEHPDGEQDGDQVGDDADGDLEAFLGPGPRSSRRRAPLVEPVEREAHEQEGETKTESRPRMLRSVSMRAVRGRSGGEGEGRRGG